ncbi:MAG: DoxX family protein [Candidatus Omnitrophica bacterium]|nr:DoxX family protein [Candidatus Omnitrophota bacterium]
MVDVAILILRIGLGITFCAHGLQKAFGLFGGAGILGVANMLSGMGFYPAALWAYILAYAELLGGLCVLLGVFTRFAAAIIFVIIAVAILKVHLVHGFFSMQGGFEYPFIIATVCLALIALGTGKYGITKF